MSAERSTLVTAIIAAAAALLGSVVGLTGSLVTTNQQLAHDRQIRLRDEVKSGWLELTRETRNVISLLAEAIRSTSPAFLADARDRALAVEKSRLQAETALLLVAPAGIVETMTGPGPATPKRSIPDALLELSVAAQRPESPEFRAALNSLKEIQTEVSTEYVGLGAACRAYLTAE
ncbi:hypothetical protein [Saccharothrix sp.]|uniref:hypothetical protein n=1 Tax=Saccharothrix sp. TaxID=1873460 RepID=UPI0028117F11|nr:hypothetical protein [Saccharothrix sp.]